MKRKISTWTLLRNLETLELESDGDSNCNGCSWYKGLGIGIGTERLGNKRTNRDYPNYGIVNIGQNTETDPG